jgi:phospholipid/cholesterol/gamma-HCH transport system substrate-binding protein
VGKVSGIELARDYRATVHMNIREGIALSEDTGASIKTSGLIGDKYIMLSPGGATSDLENGDEITMTQSAIDIESLISNYVFGSVQ